MEQFSKLPWFRFFPNDWLARMARLGLSMPGEGCFITLLSVCWIEGSIPSDHAKLARICRNYSGPGLDEAIALFAPDPTQPGKLYFPELRGIQEEAILKHRKLSDSGRRGGLARHSRDLVNRLRN